MKLCGLSMVILWMVTTNSVCNINVVNKLTKKTYVSMKHDLLLSGLEEPLLKVQLHVSELSICSIPKLPQSQLYSLDSANAARPTVLVIQQDDDDKCDIYEHILKAKSAGFSGVIFYTNAIERFRKIEPIEGFYVAVILNNDQFSFSEFQGPRYNILIFRDTSILEDCFQIVRLLLEWMVRLLDRINLIWKFIVIVVIGIVSVLVVLTPVFCLLAINYFASDRNSEQNWEYENNEDENKTTSYRNRYTLPECRRILNVNENARQREIERAYRLKALLYHPDKHGNLSQKERDKKEERFKQCNKAKEILLQSLPS